MTSESIPPESVFLTGLAIKNYKGVGDETQFIAPFGKINFFIGPNNSGKSTALSCLQKHLPAILKERKMPEYNQIDHNIKQSHHVNPIIGFGLDRRRFISHFQDAAGIHGRLVEPFVEKYFEAAEGAQIWLTRQQSGLQLMPPYIAKDNELARTVEYNDLSNLWHALTRKGGGGQLTWVKEIAAHMIGNFPRGIPQVSLIPAIRSVQVATQLEHQDWSGKGIIEELAKHQNPGWDEQEKREKFRRINEFFQSVVGNSSAQIEVPSDRAYILVHMDGKVLPLEALGTGIHQLVMLASFCTLASNQIVCVEEPELHLHPLLQRRLIEYLAHETTNQYFIATHSASIIDAVDAKIFHVSGKNGETKYSHCIDTSSKHGVFQELGYRPSDLLQTNCIIWVEGPSDRIYINHWIKAVDSKLREGIDYSIMFYGGRLLSHLSAQPIDVQDHDVSALIAIRQLNQNLCIVIDSDKKNEETKVNDTKSRVAVEVSAGGGIAWTTAGREIENYVTNETMEAALSQIYPNKFKSRKNRGQFDKFLSFSTADGTFDAVDKVAVANAVCEQPAFLNVYDLKEKIDQIVRFIYSSTIFSVEV